ncbi:MAG: alpha/beta hydrolase [Pseudomonadota bacterium]
MHSTLKSNQNRQLAYVHHSGESPGIFFLGGFNSSMQGLKALALEAYCCQNNIAFTRFDYSGHGLSSGAFEDGCVGDWLDDALAIFDHIGGERSLIVGSSMGAWIGAHLCLQRRRSIAGFIGIASAFDFTRALLNRFLGEADFRALDAEGKTAIPSCYDNEAPYTITKKLIEEGENHCLLSAHFDANFPITLIHGTGDADIDWRTSVRFSATVRRVKPNLILLKDGDHRLSSHEYLARLCRAVDEMLATIRS